jgi:hypothetical protein
MILENLAGIHEGFCNAQLISPDADLPKSFRDLQPEELNTVARIFEVTLWLQDFCEAAEEEHDADHIAPYRTICVRCVKSANLPPAPANITDIMLSNALEVRTLRETLRNQAIRDAVKHIEDWRKTQTEAMITDLVTYMTSPEPDINSLARNIGNLDPRITAWVDSIRAPLRKAAIEMVTQETVEDCIIPHGQEVLEGAWMRRQTEIEHEIRKRSSEYEAELRRSAEEHASKVEQELRISTDNAIAELKAQLDDKLANKIAQLKNHAKATIQAAKEESDSHSLTLAIRTSKAPKPSPLNIMKLKRKKGKKKVINVLDLTTPPPDAPSEMETDTDSTPTTPIRRSSDSTPTTPIRRSSAPSPAPEIQPIDLTSMTPTPPPHPPCLSLAPESVPTDIANPETIPHCAWTPSPDDRTPHAPTFSTVNPPPPANELAAIMAALAGIKAELLTKIDQVNARIDKTSGPTDIPGYMAWNEDNLAAYEHPGFVDPRQGDVMDTLMVENAAKEAEQLSNQRFYRSILHRFVSLGRMSDLHDNAYVDQWYEVCDRIFKAMSWTHEGEMSPDMDNTIYNAWRRAEVNLDEEGWNIATSFIFE